MLKKFKKITSYVLIYITVFTKVLLEMHQNVFIWRYVLQRMGFYGFIGVPITPLDAILY